MSRYTAGRRRDHTGVAGWRARPAERAVVGRPAAPAEHADGEVGGPPPPPRHALLPHDAREQRVRLLAGPRLLERLPASRLGLPAENRHPATVAVEPIV